MRFCKLEFDLKMDNTKVNVKIYHENQKNKLLATNIPIFKFVPITITEILQNQNLTLKKDNTKVKVKSYHGNQKNMFLATHRPIFKFVHLSITEIWQNLNLTLKMGNGQNNQGN